MDSVDENGIQTDSVYSTIANGRRKLLVPIKTNSLDLHLEEV